MATYTLVTTARQDESLDRMRIERNAERARRSPPAPPFATIEQMLRADFLIQFEEADSRLRQMERPRIADAYDQATSPVRAQVRTLLGVS